MQRPLTSFFCVLRSVLSWPLPTAGPSFLSLAAFRLSRPDPIATAAPNPADVAAARAACAADDAAPVAAAAKVGGAVLLGGVAADAGEQQLLGVRAYRSCFTDAPRIY
jgi:hypothetical protein